MSTAVKFWITFLLASLTAYTGYSFWRQYTRLQADEANVSKENATYPTTTVTDAKFTDSQDKPFKLDSLKGDVWLASFFFTACPGPCAQMNRAIAGLQRDYPNKDLKFVSITCDPANDTPKRLAEYAKTFGAEPKRWFFLTAPFETVQHVGQDVFKVRVGAQMHTERVMLVDRDMKVRGMYLLNEPAQVIALHKKLKSLLDNTAPPAADDTLEAPALPPTSAPHDDQPKADTPDDGELKPDPDNPLIEIKDPPAESAAEKPATDKPADIPPNDSKSAEPATSEKQP
jgi:cytochrome oxidase Cu insertion factor (SCO1/SenC/PrrC family)